MWTTDTGCVKKVQFYAALALLLGGIETSAAEMQLPLAEVQQKLTEQAEAMFARKLDECGDQIQREQGGEHRGQPGYPVRIAAPLNPSGSGVGLLPSVVELRVM